MPKALAVGVIGDFSPHSETHAATNLSFNHAASNLKVEVNVEWVPTLSLEEDADDKLDHFDALLCAPGSPYKSMKGALDGIKFAREYHRPFLGTCGGFQHVVIEYARNVMGNQDAEHAEEHPEASNPYITRLTCPLAGKVEEIKLVPGSRAFTVYGGPSTIEHFYCSYGLNPLRRKELEAAGLRFSGFENNGEVRILEMPTARFFLATLFVPQVSSSPSRPHPIVAGLLQAALR